MSDLLPCPFCGGAGVLMQNPEADYVQCGGCLAKTPRYYETVIAMSAWNRRTPATTVHPEERSDDTPTPLPVPDAGWRTIDSAPKNGTVIILYLEDEDFSTEGHWREHESGPGWYLPALNEWGGSSDQAFLHTCTHWLPLPAPPVGDGK